jgi:hypothetical protein
MKPAKEKLHVHLVVPPVLAAALDQWRAEHQHFGTRQDAIRRILERVVLSNVKGKAAA